MLSNGAPIPETHSWSRLPRDPKIEPLSRDPFSVASLLSLSRQRHPGRLRPASRVHPCLAPPPAFGAAGGCHRRRPPSTSLIASLIGPTTRWAPRICCLPRRCLRLCGTRGLGRPRRRPLCAHGRDPPCARGQVSSSPGAASPPPSPRCAAPHNDP
jgi:hypothetical protein